MHAEALCFLTYRGDFHRNGIFLCAGRNARPLVCRHSGVCRGQIARQSAFYSQYQYKAAGAKAQEEGGISKRSGPAPIRGPARIFLIWSGLRGSNPPPSAWEADTLPDELNPRSCPAPKGKNCYILYHRNSKSQGRFGQRAPKSRLAASPPRRRPGQKRRAAGVGACRSPFCPSGAGLTCSGSSCRNGARPQSSRRSSGW